MSSVSMSLKMLVETGSNDQAPRPHMGKLQRNATVSSAASTTAGSSSVSGTSSECSSDAEDEFPALPTQTARPRGAGLNAKPNVKSVWFSGSAATAAKVMKPAAAPVLTTNTSSTQQEVPCTPAVTYEEPVAADSLVREEPARLAKAEAAAELPHFEYPVDMVVRNTFLDFDGHFASTFVPPLRRRARSAEPSRSSKLADGDESEFLRPFTGLPGIPAAALQAAEPSHEGAESEDEMNSTSRPTVLALESALPLPVIGSAECPTAGSASHASGQCKPCAFFWKARGCGNGVECPFCHLCDSNEKKRRQKEKKATFHFAESFRSALLTTYNMNGLPRSTSLPSDLLC